LNGPLQRQRLIGQEQSKRLPNEMDIKVSWTGQTFLASIPVLDIIVGDFELRACLDKLGWQLQKMVPSPGDKTLVNKDNQ